MKTTTLGLSCGAVSVSWDPVYSSTLRQDARGRSLAATDRGVASSTSFMCRSERLAVVCRDERMRHQGPNRSLQRPRSEGTTKPVGLTKFHVPPASSLRSHGSFRSTCEGKGFKADIVSLANRQMLRRGGNLDVFPETPGQSRSLEAFHMAYGISNPVGRSLAAGLCLSWEVHKSVGSSAALHRCKTSSGNAALVPPFGFEGCRRGRVYAQASPRGNVTNELSLDSELAPAGGNGSSNATVAVDPKGKLYISGEGGILVSGYGWVAREVDMTDVEELRVVADIQATSFHTPAAAFDELFFDIFKAEVLSALVYRARTSPANRYACIVAESVTDPSLGELPVLVGAVDVTAYADRRVLDHLPGVEEYLYVSGMAVYSQYRRQGVATLLLQACDLRAIDWKFDYLVLHAYEDDMVARSLYARAGYEVIASDPLWMTSWVGRRRRVLMSKKCPGTNIPF